MNLTGRNTLALAGAFIISFILAYAVVTISASIETDTAATGYSPAISNSLSKENYKENFGEKRERILGELQLAIDDAVQQGKYHCCIEPACTMCYLGNWIWDDGTCNCDEMIAKGEFDKVCPQCKRGIEEGLCKSSDNTSCESYV